MKYHFAFLTLLQAVTTSSAAASLATAEVTFNIVNAPLAPDGFQRSTIVVNGQYPGTPIFLTKGQNLSLILNNQLTDSTMRRSTSINLDGFFFNSADAFNEFEPFVNACPIGPDSSYVFNVPTFMQQTGTHWYHSELSVQYVDGFRGPLIIYDPDDPHLSLYDVDNVNTIIQVGDWYHLTSVQLLQNYTATGVEPVPDSGTVNGIGRYNGGPEVPWSVINVVQGKRYRFRIINESARNVFTISIDSHNMTVIAADGQNLEPIAAQSIRMLAGMRYDVVVTANQPINNYWLNAPFFGGNATTNPNNNQTLSRGIIRYQGAPIADPTGPMIFGPPGCGLNESDLRPLVPTPVLEPDITLSFELSFNGQWNINGDSFTTGDPILSQILDGVTVANSTDNIFVLPANKTVEIIFLPGTSVLEAHPFHLHGMTMQIIKSMDSDTINTVNPISRDISGVGFNRSTIVRFTTQETGLWMYACHDFWHKATGLAVVLAVDPDDIKNNTPVTTAWEVLCPAYDALPADLQ